MNCLFILVLLGCCGRQPNMDCGCAGNNRCACRERRRENTCCDMYRCEEAKKDACSCQDKKEPCMSRYDEGIPSWGCMDSVPEMREPLSSVYPVYPDRCSCNERN